MNWRTIPPALLWFTLLGPLLVTALAALGLLGNVVDLGPSLAGNDWLLLLALPYAYMLCAPACLVAGLVFGVARGLSTRWLQTRAGALVMGGLAGAFAGAGTVSPMDATSAALPTAGAVVGLLVGAACGGFTQWRAEQSRRPTPPSAQS